MERKKTAICAGVMLLCCSVALAQTFTGFGALDDVTSGGMMAGKKIVNMVFVFTGVVGAIALVPALAKWAKHEPQTKDALTSVGIGLVVVFIILAIIKMVVGF